MEFVNNKKLKKFSLKGIKINNKKLYFGFYGLIALETGRLDSKSLETFIQLIKRQTKLKGGQFWLNLNCTIPVTKIPIATRMGKGKGNYFKKVSFVKKGQILCEISLSSQRDAFLILKSASCKLAVKSRIISY